MKKIITALLVLLFVIQAASAADVCVIAYQSRGGIDTKCIDVDEGINGYDLLNGLRWNIGWLNTTTRHELNSIGETANEGSSEWRFSLAMGSGWFLPEIGLDGEDGCWNRDRDSDEGHYCVTDEDVIGLAYGSPGAKPEMFIANISAIYVDGERQTDSRTKGGKIDKVFPGSEIEIRLEFRNLYHHTTDINTEDISVRAVIEGIDDQDDIRLEIPEFDLMVDKMTAKELDFTVPVDVEAKDRIMTIELKAKDSSGIRYDEEFTYDVEVEKREHDLRMLYAGFDKDSYSCGTTAVLNLSLINAGSEEENVNLRIGNKDLKLDLYERFKLSNKAFDGTSRYINKLNIRIPDNTAQGNYPVSIKADYSGKTESRSLNLFVSECDIKDVVKQEESELSKVSKEVQEEPVSLPAAGPAEAGEKAEKEDKKEDPVVQEKINKNLPLILTLVLAVLLFAAVLLFVVLMVKFGRR
ncbi:hypothetical protein KY366_06235 [Candidatus Woesearchaeota archaeon]|nr:hypothetical protein [Candidatus Woesearchaeota archaeon]